MSLVEYRRKRDFHKTREPHGERRSRKRKANGLRFVIQKHDASHLHYDFRLELDGVLKSWAVPKGPSVDPSQKRLAIQVEDHPIEYGDFEGVIPAGEYGGGTVMLWDHGVWEPQGDPQAAYRAGKLKFHLAGEKLRGGWMLVRRGAAAAGKPQWLLIKERDEEARPSDEYDVTTQQPASVTTGRELAEIADAADRVWGTDGEANGKKPAAKARPASRSAAHRPTKPAAAKRGAARDGGTNKKRSGFHLKHVEAKLATLVKEPPVGDAWFHEIKFDGYRLLGHLERGQVRLETRNHQDWTRKFPGIAAAIEGLPVREAVLDGEVVAFDEKGVSDFQRLQAALSAGDGAATLVYEVFDLLFLDGQDLRDKPLEERKAALESLKLPTDRGPLRYSEHIVDSGAEAFSAAERQGLEGIISKRRDRPYVGGRGADWLKIKCHQRAEFVIAGLTKPGGARHGFGALLLGYHDKAGKLLFAGRVGTGFTDQTLGEISKRLRDLKQKASPFADYPERDSAASKNITWIKPTLVAEISFSNWTRDARLRQPVFQGLREDKPADEVTLEKAKPTQAIAKTEPARDRRHAKQGRSKAARPSGGAEETTIAGVRVTHPDKMLYPEAEIAKRDLAEYYRAHAERILPQLADRPLSIVRCPDGVEGQRFFQKHPGVGTPDALARVEIREKRGVEEYLVVKDAAGLVALAQICALEIHVWGSRADAVERPDRLVFDLDPAPDVVWDRVKDAAKELRRFFADLGLESFLKTSGGKGLHLVLPIARRREWDEVASFCHLAARAIERAAPDRYVANMSKQKRAGKIFVDYLRNQRGATAIAAYSTRAKPLAPLSLPLAWEQLSKLASPDQFLLADADRLLAERRKDPWAEIDAVKQSLTAGMFKTLQQLVA